MSYLYLGVLFIPGPYTRGNNQNSYAPEEWGMLDLPGSLA